MTLSARDAKAIGVGVVGVVLILGYIFGFAPLSDRWKKATDGLEEAEQKFELLDRVAYRAGAAEERKTELAPYFLPGQSLEATEAFLPLLIDALENLSAFDSLEIQRYDPVRTQPAEHYASCSLTVLFRCDLAGLQDFLYEVAQVEPMLTIDRLHISPDKREPGTLRVQLVVSVYIVEEDLLGDKGAVG